MTNITIFHDPSDGSIQSAKDATTLTGYEELDNSFIRGLNLARCREIELEVKISLPEPLPISVQDMARVLDEMLKTIIWMTELASVDDLWARLLVQEHGKMLRIECHTTEAIEHDTSFIAKFVGIVSQLGGIADLDGNGEIQVLWAEFPLLEHTKFPEQRKTLE